MCGIVARISEGDGAPADLLAGLDNLEYRGYDSAGIAVQNGSGIDVCKREGELDRLRDALGTERIDGTIGIGHTRWSTHGPPTEANAHPHTDCTGEIAVVHNGIIDNHDELRDELHQSGHRFESETDTETVPHLIESALTDGATPYEAFRSAVDRISGSYAVAALIGDEDVVYAARNDSPLVVGTADSAYFLASDVPAFLEFTDRVTYLEDGDIVRITPDGYTVTDLEGNSIARETESVDWDPQDAGKGGYDHYMLKEIHEQPTALRQSIRGRIDTLSGEVDLEAFPSGTFEGVQGIHLVAMGTSYHAAKYAETLLSKRGVPARAFMASEYATTPPPSPEGTLVLAVSQSGETADTLSAVRRTHADRTVAVTNVVGSSLTKECDDSLFIRAGPEICVAATKSFSSQVATLSVLCERLVRDIQGTPSADVGTFLEALKELPDHVQQIIQESRAETVARSFDDADAYFFIGRGSAHPVALEGSLKFKEITYEHAEGFAAAELKHGPLALVTENTPVFAVFTGREDDTKLLSNVKEVQARGAPVVVAASEDVCDLQGYADHVLTIPSTHPDLAGILANVQFQLVAYHAAKLQGRSIDKPRNLAKSVTV